MNPRFKFPEQPGLKESHYTFIGSDKDLDYYHSTHPEETYRGADAVLVGVCKRTYGLGRSRLPRGYFRYTLPEIADGTFRRDCPDFGITDAECEVIESYAKLLS